GIRVASCSLDSERRSPAEVFTKKGTRRKKRPKISGGDIEEATPDPIPNSEVKLFGADGTAREAVWESRTLPGLFSKGSTASLWLGLFFFGARRCLLAPCTEALT